MEITRNVIIDLIPLYASGEASADTRALVEEFLRRDPSLRRLAEAGESDAVPQPAGDAERVAVERTRRVLRRRAWTLALALLCTLLPFSFVHLDGELMFLMFRDVAASRALWAAAVVLWALYFRLQRNVGTAGL